MQNLKIGRMVLGSCQTNCYFVYREGHQEVIVFDPADRGQFIYDKLKENGFTVAAVLLTHAHFDHILGCAKLKELAGVKVYAYEEERKLCGDSGINLSAGFGKPCTVEPDVYVKDQESITAADMTCRLIATPGHTAGSCCYYFEEVGILISGDTLFLESIGRTDFPTGSMSTLVRSVKEKLFPLPEEVKVYPGHGDSTTIGHEKKHNPFCQS